MSSAIGNYRNSARTLSPCAAQCGVKQKEMNRAKASTRIPTSTLIRGDIIDHAELSLSHVGSATGTII